MSRSIDPRLPTRGVLAALHARIRSAAADDPVLVRRLSEVLELKENRDWLESWLEAQIQKTPEEEQVPIGLQRWFAEHPQVLPPNSKGGWKRADVLRQLADGLKEESELTDEALRTLLVSGLSLVFMRRNEGVQDLYYHHLFADLMAESLRKEVKKTLRVPPGRGTVGWIAKRAQMLATRYAGSLRERPLPVALPSCFGDPRGRVAAEDLLTGNRSFVAVPLFSDDPADNAVLGVVFAFFPADGLFLIDSSLAMPFVSTFGDLVSRARPDILHALRTEAWVSHFHTGRSEDRASADQREGSEIEATLDLVLPDPPPPDDLVGAVATWIAVVSPGDQVKTHFRFREQSAVERMLTDELQDSAFPGRWTTPAFDELRRIVTSYKRGGDRVLWLWPVESAQNHSRRMLSCPELVVLLTTREDVQNEQAAEKVQAVLSLACPAGCPMDESSRLKDLLERASGDASGEDLSGPLRVIAETLHAFREIEDRVKQDAGRPTEGMRAVDDLRYSLCDELLDQLASALRGERRSASSGETAAIVVRLLSHLAAGDEQQVEKLKGYMKDAGDAIGRLCQGITAARRDTEQGPLDDVALLSLWLVGPRWVVTQAGDQDERALKEVLYRTDPGFQQVLSFLLQYGATLGSRSEEYKNWLFDQTSMEITYVSPTDDLINTGGDPVVIPPVFFPASEAEEVDLAPTAAVRIKAPDEALDKKEETYEVTLYRGSSDRRFEKFSFSTWTRGHKELTPISMKAVRERLSHALVRQVGTISAATVRALVGPGYEEVWRNAPDLARLRHQMESFLRHSSGAVPPRYEILEKEADGTTTVLFVQRPTEGDEKEERSPYTWQTWRAVVEGAPDRYRRIRQELEREREATEVDQMSYLAHFRHLFRHETQRLLDATDRSRSNAGWTPREEYAYHVARSLIVLIEFLLEPGKTEDGIKYWPRDIGKMLYFVRAARCPPSHSQSIEIMVEPEADRPVTGMAVYRGTRFHPDAAKVPRKIWMFMLLTNLFDNAFKHGHERYWLRAQSAMDGLVRVEVENDGDLWESASEWARYVRGERAHKPSRDRSRSSHEGRNGLAWGFDTIRDARLALNLTTFEIHSPRPSHNDGVLISFTIRPDGESS